MLGIDYAFSRPAVSAIVAGGYGLVCRYLSWLPSGKVLDQVEAHALLSAGVDIVLNWEYDAHDCLRGGPGGHADATQAVKQAQALGYPRGAAIYHSADFDATASERSIVAEYMVAARAVHQPAGYRTGCYSGYSTIAHLFDHGVIDDGWQTYAWSDGTWDPRATLRQIRNGVKVGGADCDIDEKVGAVHSWLHPDGGEMALSDQDAQALIWRVEALISNTATVADGPTKGEPNQIRAAIDALAADIAGLKSGTAPAVDASAVANALAADPAFLANIAKAVLDGAAARLAA
jgi:hypothetical protein